MKYDQHLFVYIKEILPYSFLYHRSDDHGDDHFYQIGRDEWDYTDCESCFEGIISDHAEPYGSEEVAYDCSDNHTNKLNPWFTAVVDHQSGDDCHYDKSDDVSTCRTCKFGRAACEAGEYRKTNESEQKINQVTDSSFFPSEKIQGQVNCQVGE